MPKQLNWQEDARKDVPEDVVLNSTGAAREFLTAWIKERGASGHIKKIDLIGDSAWQAWGYCNKEKGCSQKWRWVCSHGSVLWQRDGEHSEPAPVELQQQRAEGVAHLQPLQAGAQLLADGVPVQELPSARELALARRRQLDSLHRRQDGGESLAAWIELVKKESSQRAEKKPEELQWYELEWDAPWLPLRQLARPEAERKPSEGSCLLMSETMLAVTRNVINHLQTQSQPLILQGDFTYKVAKEGWGVACFGFSVKYCDRKTKLPSSGFACGALGWGPKESEQTWSCMFITFLECLRKRFGLRVRDYISGVLMDGTPGGEAALKAVLPKATRLKDLRHVQTAISRLPLTTCGLRKYTTYLEGELQFSAPLPSDLLFHFHWSTILSIFQCLEEPDLVAYIRGTLLTQSQRGWLTAEWRTGVTMVTGMGSTAQTMHQSLERFNSTLKGALPKQFHTLSMSDITFRLQCAMAAFCRKRGWEHTMTSMPAALGPRDVVQELATGDWRNIERLAWEQDEQRKLASAQKYLRFYPDNCQIIVEPGLACGLRFLKAYVFGCYNPDIKIDATTAGSFLRLLSADSHSDFMKAAEELRCLGPSDNRFLEGRQLHLYKVRTVMTTLTVVLVLEQQHTGRKIQCLCPQTVRYGTCAHDHLVRFLEKDNVSLASQEELTSKHSDGTLADADNKLRAKLEGRRLNLPPASAWSTLEYIQKVHRKKLEDRKRKMTERQEAAQEMFKSPLKQCRR